VVRGGCVFLDRDGVLAVPEFRDGRSYAVRHARDFRLYPEAAACLARLKSAGLRLAVVTNQPDIGAGHVSEAEVDDMHRQMRAALPLDAIAVCPHVAETKCGCRKPNPGMILKLAEALSVDLRVSFMVGDRASDILAGAAAGCRTVFIDRGYVAEPAPAHPDHRALGLDAATDWILAQV